MDYGRPIQFGYFVPPDSMRPMRPLELAVRAEALGINLIGAQDHPYQRRFYDVWTLLTAIAMRTKRVSVCIWLGAYKPRMLRLVGKAADGWVQSFGYMKQEAMPEANARIDDASREAGRDPAVIRRVLNVAANLTADEIAELALEHGFDTFVIGETQEDVEAELREFLENVAPKVRELVPGGRESS